jgi:hypothetical protein
MKKTAVFIATVLFLLLFPTPAYAVPALPHAFYGMVTVNGAPAPDGTQVSATVSGRTVTTNAQNPVNTAGGSYGIGGSPYLLVQGDIPNGATITFNVTNANGAATGGTAIFEAGGGPTRHDISVTITVPQGGGGGGASTSTPTPTPTPSTVVTNVFGIAGSFTINSTGIILTTVTFTSTDGKLTVTIPAGTKALDKNGNPLTTFTININTSQPAPPAGTAIIGLAYSFLPDGATFAPPIILNWSYDPNTLPSGAAEKDLYVVYWDGVQWQSVGGTVNLVTHTVTAYVSHFSAYALMGKIILAPAPTLTPTPTPTPMPTPTLTPSPTPASINWPLIGGEIIGGVIVIGLIIFFITRRRRYN